MNPCPICGQQTLTMTGNHPTRDLRAFRCIACGEFFMSWEAISELAGWPLADRFLVSAAVRTASDARKHLEILSQDLPSLRDSASTWQSPFDGVDRLLLLLGRRTPGVLKPFTIDRQVDFPLIVARGPDEMADIEKLAGQLGLVDFQSLTFTIEGLRRLDQLRGSQPDSRQAFVAMWFDASLEAAWLSGFKPGIENSKFFIAQRIDAVQHNGRIDDRIVAEIRRSGLVVADFTGQRGGVYYEAGLAQGLGIPVIWTCREDYAKDLHFDTRQYNHIIWRAPDDLRDALANRIAATVLPRGWKPG
jgi:hypothetical protein